MKKNITILIFTLGIVLATISFKTITDRDTIISDNPRKDTTYYHVYFGVERGVKEEFIKTFEYNTKLVAEIFTI